MCHFGEFSNLHPYIFLQKTLQRLSSKANITVIGVQFKQKPFDVMTSTFHQGSKDIFLMGMLFILFWQRIFFNGIRRMEKNNRLLNNFSCIELLLLEWFTQCFNYRDMGCKCFKGKYGLGSTHHSKDFNEWLRDAFNSFHHRT